MYIRYRNVLVVAFFKAVISPVLFHFMCGDEFTFNVRADDKSFEEATIAWFYDDRSNFLYVFLSCSLEIDIVADVDDTFLLLSDFWMVFV